MQGTLLRSSTLLDAIKAIEKEDSKTTFVLDDGGNLVGSVTDGDIRRGILRGVKLEDSVEEVMNRNPICVREGQILLGTRDLSDAKYLPLVDSLGKYLGIMRASEHAAPLKNFTVIMAGGKGSRLYPHTANTPKPLVEVGGEALIVSLIKQLRANGLTRIFISVNHMADQIINRLQDGSRLGVEIEYLRESQPLGTAGSLSLLPSGIEEPILVTNADLRTNCDFKSLLAFHKENLADATVAVRDYSHEVPFGVAEIREGEIINLEEKPVLEVKVSAGIYCLSPKTLTLANPGRYLDMPDLIRSSIALDEFRVIAFPVHENWADIGRPEDLEMARRSAL